MTVAGRVLLALVLLTPTLAGPLAGSSSAAPSKADVEAAKAKLETLNIELEAQVEHFNTANELLAKTKSELAGAARAKREAEGVVRSASADLEARAVQAFMGAGSQVDSLLAAQDASEFSDRLEFISAVAQNDSDLASAAANARALAERAVQTYDRLLTERRTQVATIRGRLDQIRSMLEEQRILYEQTNGDYRDALARQLAAADAAEAALDDPSSRGSGEDLSGGGFVPPPGGGAAATAIAAAKSVIGAPYVFGTAGPDTFDCSGLTLWSYAHAGVSLPHSSQMQYDQFPKVPRDQIVPGDLIFFFSPIHHVAIYLGGNYMIDTTHPGADGAVAIRSVWWDLYTGATRPY